MHQVFRITPHSNSDKSRYLRTSIPTYIHGSGLVQGLVRVVVDFVSQAGAYRPQLLQPHIGDSPGRLAVVESLSNKTKLYTRALTVGSTL